MVLVLVPHINGIVNPNLGLILKNINSNFGSKNQTWFQSYLKWLTHIETNIDYMLTFLNLNFNHVFKDMYSNSNVAQ